MLYDDILNVTWLSNANYAKTSGYDADGRMTLNDAKNWASNLSYGGYNDWRLPNSTSVGQVWNHDFGLDLYNNTLINGYKYAGDIACSSCEYVIPAGNYTYYYGEIIMS